MELKCEEGKCCQGVPYTLGEAESAHLSGRRYMDEYYWELMGWLIEEVKKLRAQTTPPPCSDVNCPTWAVTTTLMPHWHR